MALELKLIINLYIKKYTKTLGEDFLTLQDWTTFYITHDFLQIFKRVILETQGYNLTILNIFFLIDILIRYFKQSLIRNFLLLLLRVLLILHNRNVIRRITSFILVFKLDRRYLINTTLSQINPYYTCIITARGTPNAQLRVRYTNYLCAN